MPLAGGGANVAHLVGPVVLPPGWTRPREIVCIYGRRRRTMLVQRGLTSAGLDLATDGRTDGQKGRRHQLLLQ